jgi:hypothetical protein
MAVYTVQPLSLLVWNPITGQQEEVPLPTEVVPEYSDFTGAVLCAVEGCETTSTNLSTWSCMSPVFPCVTFYTHGTIATQFLSILSSYFLLMA